jgi:chromosome segregation ATPase
MPEEGEILRDAGDYHDLKNKVQLARDLLYLAEQKQSKHADPGASAELQAAQQALEGARRELSDCETRLKDIYGSMDGFRQAVMKRAAAHKAGASS